MVVGRTSPEQAQSLHVLMRLLHGKRTPTTSPTRSPTPPSPTRSPTPQTAGLDLLAGLALGECRSKSATPPLLESTPELFHIPEGPTQGHCVMYTNSKRKRLASECLPPNPATQSRKRCKRPCRPYLFLKDDKSKRYLCLLCKRRVGDLRWITRHKCPGDPNFKYRPLKKKVSQHMNTGPPERECCTDYFHTNVIHQPQRPEQIYSCPPEPPLPTRVSQFHVPVHVPIPFGSSRPKRQAAIKSRSAWSVLKPDHVVYSHHPMMPPQLVVTIPTVHSVFTLTGTPMASCR